MAAPSEIVGKNLYSITVYNGSGTDIPANTAVAADASYPPETVGCPGVKTTTGDTDFIGVTLTIIPAGKTGSMQPAGAGGIAVAIAGGTITYGTTLAVMSNASGQVVAKTAGKRGAGVPLSSAISGGNVKVLLGAGVDNA